MSAFQVDLAKCRQVAVAAASRGWAKCPPYLAAIAFSAAPVVALDVPSGQPISLQEVLIDSVGTENWVRFRFVAENITREDDYEQTANDMTHLCEKTALPYLTDFDLKGDVIVISIADRATEFGVADPDATQFFEAYRPVDNTCIWEGL